MSVLETSLSDFFISRIPVIELYKIYRVKL